MASAVDSRLAYARLSAVATASRLPTANRGSNNSYTTSWDTTGDIFERLQEHDMAIVFGHVGLGHMASCWRNFSRAERTLADIADPFTTMPNSPRRTSSGRWLWFIPDGQNHGMTEDELRGALDRALSWAQAEGHRRIVNGCELWPRVGDGLREGGGVSWGVTKPPGLQARSDTP